MADTSGLGPDAFVRAGSSPVTPTICRAMAELADAVDSKSTDYVVWVRPPLARPIYRHGGIGRHIGFKLRRESMQVQLLLPVPVWMVGRVRFIALRC